VSTSLRLRLALWYCALTGAVVVLVCFYSYAVHSRAHYDELDSTLRSATLHFAAELADAPTDAERGRILTSARGRGTEVAIYDAGGRENPLLSTTPVIALDIRRVLAGPSEPAYPVVAGVAPPLDPAEPGPGAFGLSRGSDGGRWRVYVLPTRARTGSAQYVVTALPLSHLDASVRQFARLMAVMAVVGCALAFLAGWLIAGRALRPITMLTETARGIAQSRVFSRRVVVGAPRDELGRLATTFNEMLASLEQAYAAQQRFVSDASHELRAPITVIQANLELLQRHSTMPAREREQAIGEAYLESARLARLVADLLALARADAGVPMRRERVELDSILMNVLGEARHLAHGQQLEIEAIEPVVVEGDPDRLKQLLLIPLDNALRYTPGTGRISIALRRRRTEVEISVRDTGIGIDASELPHIFERFYRADPARTRDPGGTGLGLGIARWIAMQHGGAIRLASEPGEGTTVTIRLPAIP
jgi:signal transduction histidine kinase